MAFVEDRWKDGGNRNRRRWRARYRGPDGKERSRSFLRKADAQRFATEQAAAVQAGHWVDLGAGKASLDAWAREVMGARLLLRPATRSRDHAYLRNHVLADFGARRVGEIQKADVQDWILLLVETKGLSPRTVRECYRLLASVMREAVEFRLIAETPCRRISLPRIVNKERRFLTTLEVRRLADSIDRRFRAFVYFGAYLGLRWAEVAGLKRSNLDLAARRVPWGFSRRYSTRPREQNSGARTGSTSPTPGGRKVKQK